MHGRALQCAAGVKLTRPDLEVIAVGGDGDGYLICGNHFIHACVRLGRRTTRTTIPAHIKAAGASANRRCEPSFTYY
jgi:Thiamine pyrophosphate enzyme, C-terminal TPP binding domain